MHRKNIISIFISLSRARRLQLGSLLVIMILSSFAEIMSIGALVPLLTLLSNPERITAFQWINELINHLNLEREKLGVYIVIGFSILILFATTLRLGVLWLTNKVVFGIGQDWGVGLFLKTIHRDYSWHIKRNSSEVIGAANKINFVVLGYLGPLLNAAAALVLAAGIIGFLIYLNPFAAIFGATFLGVVYSLLAMATRNKLTKNGKIIALSHNKRVQGFQEALGNIRDISIDGSQGVYTEKFSKVEKDLRDAQSMNSFFSASPRVGIEGLALLILALYIVAFSNSGELANSLPILGAIGLGVQKLLPQVQTIYSGWNAMFSNSQSLKDVLDLLKTQADEIEASPVSFNKSIELESVRFSYMEDREKNAINDVSLKIKKGEIVGIVGETGSGKSTLVDILMGLIPATSGALRVDGKLIESDADLKGWRKNISHVPQEIFLADCTLAENIGLGVDIAKIDYERLRTAAKAAQIAEFIETLPRGYKTIVGERGVKISGGQRQRIGIARALYKAAGLLILDEATSALDSLTERSVIGNIYSYYPGITVVMIAHRLTTLYKCDWIIKLEDGEVQGIFSYNDLMIQNV